MLIELQAAKKLFIRTSARPWSLCILYIGLPFSCCSPGSFQQTLICYQWRGMPGLYHLCFDQLRLLMSLMPGLLCVCSLECIKPLFLCLWVHQSPQCNPSMAITLCGWCMADGRDHGHPHCWDTQGKVLQINCCSCLNINREDDS